MPRKVRVDVGARTPVGARCRTCSRPCRSRTPKTSWTLFRQQTVSATQRASSGAGEATARPYGRLYRHAASHKMLGRPSASRGSTSSRIPGLATRWFSTWSRAASSPAPSRSSADEHPEMPRTARDLTPGSQFLRPSRAAWCRFVLRGDSPHQQATRGPGHGDVLRRTRTSPRGHLASRTGRP